MSRFGLGLIVAMTVTASAIISGVLVWRDRTIAETPTAQDKTAPAATRPFARPAHPSTPARSPAPGVPPKTDTQVDDNAAAAKQLIEQLAVGQIIGPAREHLIGQLRLVPGPLAEGRLIEEAKRGPQNSTRTMAIDALVERHTDTALEALANIARTDPNLPAHPLIAQPRDPSDTSTELPDEQTFTPRMQAMAALAQTKDPRAIAVLADLTRTGADESLRMEAARHLGSLHDDARASEALRAAIFDPSAYVRLSALHGLDGSPDPNLPTLLARIAAEDRDAGVRLLAQAVLSKTLAPPQ